MAARCSVGSNDVKAIGRELARFLGGNVIPFRTPQKAGLGAIDKGEAVDFIDSILPQLKEALEENSEYIRAEPGVAPEFVKSAERLIAWFEAVE